LDHLLGTVVLNYRLAEKLGEGGFGAVYRARHEELGREVAIKVLRSDRAGNADVVQRFLREAQVILAIGHPSIVEIENAGRLPSGEPFYVMELVPGLSLAQRLVRIGPLDAKTAIGVFAPVAEALAAAHDKGIVHRDLKPHNIMVEEQHGEIVRVKLLDFGIAKILAMGDASTTGDVLGSPHFMAPEQAQSSRRATPASDVYSFGATLFNALSGKKAIDGDSVPAVLLAAQRDTPSPLARYARNVPRALEDALERCLAKDPAERPPSIRDAWSQLRAALLQANGMVTVAADEGSASTVTSAASGASGGRGATSSGSVTPFAHEVSTTPPRGRSRRAWWLAVPAVIAAAIAAVIVLGGNGRDGAGTTGPTAIANRDLTTSDARASDLGADAPPVTDAGPEPERDAAEAPPPLVDAAATVEPPARRPRRASTPPASRPAVRPPPSSPGAPALPAIACDRASFAATYQAVSPSKSEVRAAIARLRECRGRGLISESEHTTIQSALVARLTPT
jgi:serine/threonine protein kinase